MKAFTHYFDALERTQAFGFGVSGPMPRMGGATPELNILKGENFELVAVDALYPGLLAQELPNAVIVANHTHFMPSLDPEKPKLGKFNDRYLRSIVAAFENAQFRDIGTEFDVTVYRGSISSICYRRWDQITFPFSYVFSRTGTMYPDWEMPINHDILFMAFKGTASGKAEFVIVYHANHPTNSVDSGNSFGSDFWDIVREELRQQLGDIPIFCLPGNLGDIRSKTIQKRFRKLPAFKWNRKFSNYRDAVDLKDYYEEYRTSVSNKEALFDIKVRQSDISLEAHSFEVSGDMVLAQILKLGELEFRFIPFEVSSLFDERSSYEASARKFNVSCSGAVKGYLPYPTQLAYGGYEVVGSLPYMSLKCEQVVSGEGQDFLELKEYD